MTETTVPVSPFQRERFRRLTEILAQDPAILKAERALERARTDAETARAALHALTDRAPTSVREAAAERLERAEAELDAAERAAVAVGVRR